VVRKSLLQRLLGDGQVCLVVEGGMDADLYRPAGEEQQRELLAGERVEHPVPLGLLDRAESEQHPSGCFDRLRLPRLLRREPIDVGEIGLGLQTRDDHFPTRGKHPDELSEGEQRVLKIAKHQVADDPIEVVVVNGKRGVKVRHQERRCEERVSHDRRRTLIPDLGSRLREVHPDRRERAWHEVKPDILGRKKLGAGLAPQAVGLLGEKKEAEFTVPAAGVQHPLSPLERAGEACDLLQEMPIRGDVHEMPCVVQVGSPEFP